METSERVKFVLVTLLLPLNKFDMLFWRFPFDFAQENIGWIIQPAFACSKLTIEALEQGVEYVQS